MAGGQRGDQVQQVEHEEQADLKTHHTVTLGRRLAAMVAKDNCHMYGESCLGDTYDVCVNLPSIFVK